MGTLIMRGETMLRKNFLIPGSLAERAETLARKSKSDLSTLIREAILEFVERREKEELEKELAKECRQWNEFNKKFSAEWAQYETRFE